MILKLDLKYKQDIESTSKDSKTVIESWGLQKEKEHKICNMDFTLEENKIYYICGYSGSGKSSILNEIHKLIAKEESEISLIYIENYRTYLQKIDDNKLMIDYFPEIDYNKRLKILGKCGLTEVWKYITRVKDLSDGEKFRFMLYYNIMEILQLKKDAYFIIDEFVSTLDRITAKVVAQNIHKLRELLNKEGINITFILASAHEDLISYLKADYNYFKEFQPVLNKIN